MSNYPYPFDITGTLPSNHIPNEEHALSFYNNPYKAIIPVFAPFFRNSIKVKHVETGEYLTEGMDYYLGHIFESAQMQQRYSIYGSISLVDTSLEGNLVLEYQTLGGPYTIPYEEIQTYLNKPFERPQSRNWTEVMKYPREIFPVDPINSLPEAIERDPVTRALNEIQLTLRAVYDEQSDRLDQIFDDLKDVEEKIMDWGFPFHDHLNGNAHDPQPGEFGALPINAAAKDSLKAYNMSLAQLVEYVRSININQAKLDEYLRLDGGVVRGRIIMDRNNAIIKNANSTTTIDLRTGDVRINTQGQLTVRANDPAFGDDGALLRAGFNRLVVGVDGSTKNDNTLIYNGFMVLHAGNIADYIPDLQESKLALTTGNTEYVTLRGAGRGAAGAPLDGVVTFPRATDVKKGVILLTHRPDSGTPTMVPSMEAIASIRQLAADKLDNTVKINGKRLTDNIIITDVDLGLGNVDNTAPNDKLSSQAFIAEVAKKADIDHKHDISEFTGWTYAGIDIAGFFKISNNLNDTEYNLAATPDVAFNLKSLIEQLSEAAGQYLPVDAIDLTAYGNTSGLPISVSGSFAHNSIPSDRVGWFWGIVEAGYLKFIRNGESYGEVGRPYLSYVNIDSSDRLGSVINTTIPYEPGFIPAGWQAHSLTGGNSSWAMLCIDNGSGTRKLILVNTNGKFDATFHIGYPIAEGALPFHQYDIWETNERVYILAWQDLECTTFTLQYIEKSNLSATKDQTMTTVSINSTYIGGSTGLQSSGKIGQVGAKSGNYRYYRELQSEDNRTATIIHAGASHRQVYVDGNFVYIYMARKGYLVAPTASRFPFTHATHRLNLSTGLLELLGGWPASLDVIPEMGADGTYIGHGQPDRRAGNENVGGATNFHDSRGQVINIGPYEISVAGLGRSGQRVGINAKEQDPMTRIMADTRVVQSVANAKSVPVNSGGGIGFRPTGITVAKVPHPETGQDTVMLVGRNNVSQACWAQEVDLGKLQTNCRPGGTYEYGKSYALPTDDWTRATQSIVEQASGNVYPVFLNRFDRPMYNEVINYDEVTISRDPGDPLVDEIVKSVNTVLVNGTTNGNNWNAVVLVAWRGRMSSGRYHAYMRGFRAKVQKSSNSWNVKQLEVISGLENNQLTTNQEYWNLWTPDGPSHVQVGHYASISSAQLWISGGRLYLTLPLTSHSTITNNKSVNNYTVVIDYSGNDVGSTQRSYGGYGASSTGHNPSCMIHGYMFKGAHDGSQTAVTGYGYDYVNGVTVSGEGVLVLTAIRDNWTVFFSTEYPYFTSGQEFTIAPDQFDLRALYSPNHQNRIFYIYANVIAGNAVYELAETLVEDYGARTYIGYVRTGTTGIVELDVRAVLRLGRVQELLDHINNPIAHTGEELGGAAIGLGKVANLRLTHEWTPFDDHSEQKYVSENAVLEFIEAAKEKYNPQGYSGSSPVRDDFTFGFPKFPNPIDPQEESILIASRGYLANTGNMVRLLPWISTVGATPRITYSVTINRSGSRTSSRTNETMLALGFYRQT